MSNINVDKLLINLRVNKRYELYGNGSSKCNNEWKSVKQEKKEKGRKVKR